MVGKRTFSCIANPISPLILIRPDMAAAGPGSDQAAERGQHGGLAGPVGTEEGGELAAPDLEVDAAQHLDPAVAGPQPAGLEGRRPRARHARSSGGRS